MRQHKCVFALTSMAAMLYCATAVAAPPVGMDSTVTIPEDQGTSIVLNVSDPDGDQLTFTLFVAPTNGIAVVSPNSNSVQYTPNQDYNNTLANPEVIVVKVSDGSNEITVRVDVLVNPVNDPPVANVGTAVTNEDTATGVDLRPLASDVDGDMLTYSITQQPQNGTITGAAPNFTYRPNADFFGTDTISYRADDGKGGVSESSVTITVNPVNDPPVIKDESINTQEDTEVTVTLLGTDVEGDQITYTVTQNPMNGTLMGTSPSFQYKPNANFVGMDTIKYKASDGKVESDEKTITINVGNNNDAPTWVAPTPEDMAVININEGDSFSMTIKGEDPDGDTLVYGIEGKPDDAMFDTATGVLTWNPDYTDKGEYMITVTVKDAGTPLSRMLKLVVNIVDDDGDFLPLTLEQKLNLNPMSKDSDGDTIADNEEVGPDWNAPLDSNNNSVIDALDQDSDSDTIPDSVEAGDKSLDTVPVDTDGDLIPDYRDDDSDADTIEDANDNCVRKRNKDQSDVDGDGDGDACDDDIDNDGLPNAQDSCPDVAAMTANGCEKRVAPTKEEEGCSTTSGVSHSGTVPGGLLMMLIGGLVAMRRRRK